MTAPFCFLDRDGTIIPDRGYLSDPDGVQLLPGAAEGLRRIAALGYRLVIVSNQSGVGRGFFTAQAAERTSQRLLTMLAGAQVAIAAAFACFHAPHENCACRKPARGMVDRAVAALGGTLDGAVVIGDKKSDMDLAAAIDARAILLTATPASDAGRAQCACDLIGAAALLAGGP